MKRSAILVLLLVLYVPVFSGDITIGLYYGKTVESFVFSAIEGQYTLYGDQQKIKEIQEGTILHVQKNGSLFTIQDTSLHYGSFHELVFKAMAPDGIFQIRSLFPSLTPRESEGDLRVTSRDDVAQFLNTLDMELYIAGTIEAEGGSSAHTEYYKAQAIISRTYAVKNMHRHAHEGFNLCDGVHCQAYNGKSRMNKKIVEATLFTHEMILVNEAGAPVVTAYHSNCGGITASAGQVWSHDVSHLSPVRDPFCDKASNRSWTRQISLQQWKDYLAKKGLPVDVIHLSGMNSSERHKYFDTSEKLLMNEIRMDMNLKSAYFQITVQGNIVIFKGHGYGHGLGLCQQGAMEMARVNYTYVDILMFYYRSVKIVMKN